MGHRAATLCTAMMLLSGTCGLALGEELPGYGRTMVQRLVTLGEPNPTTHDPFLPEVQTIQPVQAQTLQPVQAQSLQAVEGNQTYIARRIDELPPPVEQGLPLPGYQKVDRMGGQQKPFTVDYVFMGRAGVEEPATSVKMSDLGVLYEHHWAYSDRWMFTFRPVAGIKFLSGPGGPVTELPEQLYKVAIDIQADFEIAPRLGLSLGITPGVWTDFKRVDSDDFRLPARLLGTYSLWDGLFLAGGVVWTDNFYSNLLPGIGVIWEVNERTRLELLYPRSRLGYRFHDNLEVYGVFERGGDTYNIRANSVDEDFQYRDLRVMLGINSEMWSRATLFAEVGAAFNRELRFDNQPDLDVNRAFLFRVGARF